MTDTPKATCRNVGAAVALCWLLPIGLSMVSHQADNTGRYAGNVSSLVFAPLFVLLAAAVGDWLLDRALRLRGPFAGRCVFAAGLGLGAFSIGTLLIGLIGLPSAWTVQAALVLLAALLCERTGRLLAGLRDAAGRSPSPRRWLDMILVAVILFLVCLNVLRAFTPPIEYDEREYHLAAPARYVRDGRISFISNNAYASFPANVEMLFLDGMLIRGGVVEGLALGRLINVALGLLAACAAGVCAAALFTRSAAVPAAAILYTWPRVNKLNEMAYVELGLMLYVGLALLAAHHYAKGERKLPHLALLGVVCGLAAGCKYPAVLFVCLPAELWVLLSDRPKRFLSFLAGLAALGAVWSWAPGAVPGVVCWAALLLLAAGIAYVARRQLGHGLIFALVAFAVLSPWLIKNSACARNPVYPLLGRWFDAPTWSARKDARWQNAHSAKDRTAGGMWAAVRKTVTETRPKKGGPITISVLLIAFLPFAFVRREWRRTTLLLLGLTLLSVAAWLLFTHRIIRFIMPWLIPLVVINAAGAVAFEKRAAARIALGVALIALSASHAWATYVNRVPRFELELLLGHYSTQEIVSARGTVPGAVWHINRLPEGSRTLFLGDARTLYCTADVIAPTVFDENPLDGLVRGAESPEDILRGLRDLGVTHIYVNLDEIHRLQWSYAFRHDGRICHGYSSLFENRRQREHLAWFLRRYCRVVYPEAPPGRQRLLLTQNRSALDRELMCILGHHDRARGPRLPRGLPDPFYWYVYQIDHPPL